ncbi:unnamed protein product, partial [Discosporangium mesarthrocarpum]
SSKQVVVRTRDTDASVRKVAFDVLNDRVPVEILSPEDRSSIVAQGLTDRSAEVKNACRARVCNSWLSSTNPYPVKLLSLLGVIEPEETVSL